MSIAPFLTWAGGKRWLVNQYAALFPAKFNTYYEPFLGSGATFFSLCPQSAYLSDLNIDLINAYKQIQMQHKLVVEKLYEHSKEHSHEYYYTMRDCNFSNDIERAAQFIYLNRTCWNGLYRVNKSGNFNVPIGSKTNVLLNIADIEKISNLLKKITISHGDFCEIDKYIQHDDFIYYDPPYTVRHNNNGFIKYNKKLFSWEDQERLYASALAAKSKGAFVAVSNANHQSIRDLYSKDFKIHVLERYVSISGCRSGRKKTEEVFITSY